MNANTTPEKSALLAQPRQQFDLSPQTFDQALTFSQYLADSDMVPKDYKGKPGNCLIAMQWGAEVGLKPLQALQNLAVINGRPALWGDSVIAIVRASPLCEYVIETDDGHTATCKVKRRGEPEQVRTFSVDDARSAGLAGKQGPWTQFPKRMRQMRARAFALRDVFPDVLRGLPVAEEVMDTPTEKHMGPAEVVPQAPAHYPAAEFDKNLPAWRKVIESGKKTASDLIAMVETKGALTDEQKAALRAIKPPQPAADVQDVQPKDEAPEFTYAQVADKLTAATDVEQLAEAGSLIGAVVNADHRAELVNLYEQRATEMEAA